MKIKEIFNTFKQKLTPAKIFFFITLCLVIFVRLRLLSMPLDRDEGCWAYGGWLLLDGNPPYKYFYELKMPGIYFLYTLIMLIFGQSTEGIRIGVLVFILINIFLVYKLFRKISGDSHNSLLSSAFYGLLSLDSGTLSLSGYSTHFVLTFVMLAVIFAYDALKQNISMKFFISGLFAGISFIIKQPAIYFILFFLIYIFIMSLLSRCQKKKIIFDIFLYITGALAVFFIICIIMQLNGVFDRFWFMTIKYAMKHSNMVNIKGAIGNFIFFLKYTSVFFNTILFFFIVYIFFIIFFIKDINKKILYIILLMFSFSFVLSGFYFRGHYFIIFALPAALVFFDKFTDKFDEKEIISAKVKYIFFICSFILLIITQNNIFFKLNPYQVSRYIFGINPFPESLEIAKYLVKNTNKDDRIAILGSESQIFFYAKRKSATGYTSFIHLMENNQIADEMQKEAIREIEDSQFKYLIFVNIPTSWAKNPGSSTRIFEWFQNKVQKKQIEVVGLINIISNNKTEFIWGKKAVNYKLKNPLWIAVFKIKNYGLKN